MRRVSGVGNIQVQNVDTGLTSANVTSATAQDVALYFTATGTNSTIYLRVTDAGTVGAYDFVSVREIAGTHAIQATAASRPVLRNRYNLLTYSEQFDNAVWVKGFSTITANAAVAPDGTTTASKLSEDNTTNTHTGYYNSITALAVPYTFNVYLKQAERSWAFIRFGFGAYFDLATGAVGTVDSGVTAAITAAGNGWYRCSVTQTASAGVNYPTIFTSTGNGANNNYTGTTGNGIFVWGADLRSANDTIYPYQRIEAATVYDSDTSKFPLYLACDGSDDSLYTAANLDLSSTDKVTVFAGVTKLSDAATAIFLELSADAGVNSGSFFVTAPPTAGQSSISFYGNGNGVSGTSLFNNAQVAAPVTAVIAAQADIPADSTTLRVDAVQVASSATNLGTGNFGAYPLYIGRRNNTNLPFNGRIQQLIVRGAASSAAEISSTERYIAGKQGRSL
jgi:hypothetical protein